MESLNIVVTVITHHHISKGLVKDAHVKAQPLVDPGPGLDILGVQGVILAIGVDQVPSNGSALVHAKVTVLDGRHVVLRIDLDPRQDG